MIKQTLTLVLLSTAAQAMQSDNEAFFKAVARDDIIAIKKFLKTGTNITAIHERSGQTALHIAVNKPHSNNKVLELLIKKGADINAAVELECQDRGKTPLHMAVVKNNQGAVAFLLAHEADATRTTRNGGTPLHIAAMLGRTGIVKLLLESDLDINAATCFDGIRHNLDEGWPPLYFALDYGRVAIAKLLLAHGARTDIVDAQGNKALHIAAGRGHCDATIVTIDMEPKGTMNPVSKPQVFFNGQQIVPELVALIRDLDQELNAKNILGLTALDYAKLCKCDASVTLPYQRREGPLIYLWG